jgi:hypothetical protein
MGAPTTERSKVATVFSLLTRRVLEWATAVWERGEEEMIHLIHMALFRGIFDHPPEGGERLFQLWLDDQTTAE